MRRVVEPHFPLLTLPDFSYFGGAESLPEDKRSPRRTVVVSPSGKDDRQLHPGPPLDPVDFLWLMTEEPHRSRRMAIMKAHPQVTKLMGHEPLTKYVVLGVVSLQLYIAIHLRHTHPLSFMFLAFAYALGGTANHNLFLAIHEITHNLAFKSINANKALAVFANLPIGIPYSAAFKVRLYSPLWCECRSMQSLKRAITWNTTSISEKTVSIQISLRTWNCSVSTTFLGKLSLRESVPF